MVVTQREFQDLANQINDSYALLVKRLDKLEAKLEEKAKQEKKPAGRPKKEAA